LHVHSSMLLGVWLLLQLKHPNLVQFIDYFEDAEYCFLIMELMTGGELFTRIVEKVCGEGCLAVCFCPRKRHPSPPCFGPWGPDHCDLPHPGPRSLPLSPRAPAPVHTGA
jgi:hypothetical protein